MVKRSKILQNGVLVMIIVASTWSVKAQDPEFSQFYAAPLYLNPAYTGTTVNPKFHINFRDQWPGFSHAYVSYAASYDQFFPGINSGLGVIFVGDQAGQGMYNTNSIQASYSYQINFSESFAMKAGVQGGYIQKRIDWNKFFFLDQINPVTGFYDAGNNLNPTMEPTPSATEAGYFDVSVGLMAFTKNVFGGFALKHLTEPVETFTNDNSNKLPRRYTVHGGALINFGNNSNSNVTLSPNFLYTQQDLFKQLNIGSYLSINKFFGGLWFRHNFSYSDAMILSVGVQYNVMKIGYSYDFTILDLQSHSGGTHEISLVFNFDDLPGANDKRKLRNTLACPSVF